MMRLSELASLMQFDMRGADVELNGMSLDSRTIKPGNVYLATKGAQTDGHDYIVSAINNGAVAVICEKNFDFQAVGVLGWVDENLKQHIAQLASNFYQNPTANISVTGITGTNGKTSISFYLMQMLKLLGSSCGQIGTLGLQLEGLIETTHNTTPDACTLQRFFAQAVEKGIKNIAMEVSSHALEQGRVDNIEFSIAIFSNLSHDHLDYHKTMDAYFEAKAALFKLPSLALVVINIDDEYGQMLIRTLAAYEYKIFSYSLKNDWADVYATNIKTKASGIAFNVVYKEHVFSVQTQLIGRFNISNILSVVAVLIGQGYELASICRLLPQVFPVKGRMEVVDNDKSILALVDYAHTPDALKNVLSASKEYVEQQKLSNEQAKLITVFGCGGDRDKAKRPLMAEVVEAASDLIVVTADNPRSELQANIAQDIAQGFQNNSYILIDDRKQAIEYAVDQAKQGDTILLAGKGHEEYQLIGRERRFFSDVNVLSQALAVGGSHV